MSAWRAGMLGFALSACAQAGEAGPPERATDDGSSTSTGLGSAAQTSTSGEAGSGSEDGSTHADTSEGSDSGPPPEEIEPSIAIVFPPAGDTLADLVVVRGTATFDEAVAGVDVSGVAATSDDGFATWRAEVPLALGSNAIVATLQGIDEVPPVEVELERVADESAFARGDTLWGGYQLHGMDVDESEAAVLIADGNFDAIVRIELATGDHAFATCSEATPMCEGGGDGYALVAPRDLAIEQGQQSALMVDSDVVVRVDYESKARTVVSGDGLGDGPAIGDPAAIAIDVASGLVYTSNAFDAFVVELATGDRMPVSSAPDSYTTMMVGDFARDRLLVLRSYMDFITAIDIATGAREPLAGSGVALVEPVDLAIDPARDRVWLWDAGLAAVVALELATDERTIVASDSIGRGAPLLAAHIAYGRGLLFAHDGQSLLAIDPVEGDRVVVSK